MAGEAEINRLFPNLGLGGYRIARPATPDYNCIGWAAGDDGAWWWPDPMFLSYWPTGVPREPTLEAFILTFQAIGYSLCETAEVEPGFEKIAIYVNERDEPTHAARQLPDGYWTSKLGPLEDIDHTTLEGLTGDAYGQIALIMKRKAGQPEGAP